MEYVKLFHGTIYYRHYCLLLLLLINTLGQYYRALVIKNTMLNWVIYRYFHEKNNKYKRITISFMCDSD